MINLMEAYRVAARENYGQEGEIEIDDDATVNPGDNGAYVAAWVWVSKENAREMRAHIEQDS